MRVRALLLVLSLLLLTCTGERKEIGGPPAADLSPEQLIARTIQRYENATHYRDTTTIRTRIAGHESVLSATTRFKRPRRLDLILRDDRGVRYSIAAYIDDYIVSDRRGRGSREREDALIGAVGVTSGYSTMLPPFLLDASSLSPLAHLRSPSIRGLETLHGERCTHLEAADDEGRRFEIWIGEKSHAIRRTLRVIDRGVPQPFENQLDYETVSFASDE